MSWYADTSALVKLVIHETETVALRQWLREEDPTLVTSDLTRTELRRAVRRADEAALPLVRDVLDTVTILTTDSSIFDHAGLLDPVLVRSLDALHLTCALELGDELDGLVAYDARLIDAARTLGLSTISPGLS
ncbi:MAG: type II toxin-antitoxin system VapC family toxin [Propionibacteriaceae bacterium]|nr:type II toxin-antitoxin system VapC family toxin [Propionibacteriaceae bacterium]